MAELVQATYKLKDLFFDTAEVQRRVGEGKARAMSRQGSFLRKRWRTQTLRRRKSPSMPGSPPHVHSTDARRTLRNILFALDKSSDSLVVGPVKLNQVNFRSAVRMGNRASVPELMEKGGTAIILEEAYRDPRGGRPKEWFRQDLRRRRRPDKVYRKRRAKYKPRPSAQPTLDAEVAAGTIADSWQNQVRG